MRDTEHFKKHLSLVTEINNEVISKVEIEDPFHHTKVFIYPTFWERVTLLFYRPRVIEVSVHVRSDGVSQGRWFQGADICEHCQRRRIDLSGAHPTKPGYEHSDERWCEACYYEYPVVKSVAHGLTNCEVESQS
jgi:hypothetical protein